MIETVMPQSVYISAPIEPFEASIKHLRIPRVRQKALLALLDRAWARHASLDTHSVDRTSTELADAGVRVQQEVTEANNEAERELQPTRQAETGKQRKSASAA
jgi:hypothetical protein